jgi:phosphoheptose isomerase
VSEFQTWAEDYYRRFRQTLAAFDPGPLAEVLEVFERVQKQGGTIWAAGNGGSAAISDHLVCDTTKWTYVEGLPPVRSVSLAANGPMLTALANDLAYEQVFRRQLVYYLRPEDAVLLISGSGNSPNVVEACRYAKEQGVPTIAFVGFDGGELKKLADHVVWVPVNNWGMAEDIHQSVMHCLTQYLRYRGEKEQGKAYAA